MARLFGKLATLATAVEAARRYAKNNPDKAGKFLDQAASFVDKQTKGRYSGQISGVARKAKGMAGIPEGPATPHGVATPPPVVDPRGNGTAPTQAFPPAAGAPTTGTGPASSAHRPQPTPRQEN